MRLRHLLAAALLTLGFACSPPPAPTEPPFSGVWVGPLPVSATEQRTFAVVLHERADLKLMGYLLGGTSRRSLLGALRSGDRALMVFQMEDGAIAGPIGLSGEISGDTLAGTAFLGDDEFAVTWTRRADALEERRFIFAESVDGGEPAELSIVQDGTGALVSGNFTSSACAFIACAAAVTSFSETPAGDIAIGLASDGACPGAATITASFNASTFFYDGAWTHTDGGACGGAATSGTLIGGRDLGTRSTHAASVLANLGQLADDIEGGVAFGATHAAVAPSYLHFGQSAADFLAARNAEVAKHAGASVEFHSFTSIRTVTPAGHHPMLPNTLGVTFADERRDASGAYRSVAAGAPAQSGLYYLVEGAGAWRLNGNQIGPFDLPFAYTLGTERLIVPTEIATAPLHLSLGGWGAHFGPQTGHLEGNAKIDMMAQYVGALADLTELANGPGGTPGACDMNLAWAGSGEICGVWGGLGGELIRARIFTYRAPYAGTVTEVAYEERPRPASAPQTHYFDNVPHWSVTVEFPGGLAIRFGHLGQITGAVRAGLMANGINPDTYAPSSTSTDWNYCPPSPGRCRVNVLNGATFAIAAGDEIAKAQTDAAPIPGHPGYYRGQLGPSLPPWSQVEFFMSEALGFRGADVCAYQYLPAAQQSAFAALMTGDMLNPHSLRYSPENGFVRPWKYRAEAELCNNGGYLMRDESDFSSIHAQLGGWYERDTATTAANEQFTIARIHQGAAAYDASLYDVLIGTTQPTQYLVGRARTDGAAFSWTVPGIAAPVIEHYPAGEVLELTSSSFVVKWREIGPASLSLYQRAAFEIDGDGLRIQWGGLATTLAGAPAPVLAPGAPCNDTTTLCYNRARP